MEYRLGSKDKKVGEIQTYLNQIRSDVLRSRDTKYQVSNDWGNLVIDNDFGILTERAVRGFQKMLKISENGIVGNTTWNFLSTFSIGPTMNAAPVFRGIYKVGDEGPEVRKIQELLNKAWESLTPDSRTAYRWEYIAVDGVFGERTKCAVIAFQTYQEIEPALGEVGDTTLGYLRNPRFLGRNGQLGGHLSNTEIETARNQQVNDIRAIMSAFISSIGQFLEQYLPVLERRRNIEFVKLENLNRRLRGCIDLRNVRMAQARMHLADISHLNLIRENIVNTTFFRRLSEFVSPVQDSLRAIRDNQIRSWSNAQEIVFRVLRDYNAQRQIERQIALLTNQNMITYNNVNRTRSWSMACSFVGFALRWGEFIWLIATYEDTNVWNSRMERCIYQLMDDLIVDVVAAIVGLVLSALVTLEIIAAPVELVVGIGLVVVGLIGALIMWWFERQDIYPSQYLQDAGYSATYQLLYR